MAIDPQAFQVLTQGLMNLGEQIGSQQVAGFNSLINAMLQQNAQRQREQEATEAFRRQLQFFGLQQAQRERELGAEFEREKELLGLQRAQREKELAREQQQAAQDYFKDLESGLRQADADVARFSQSYVRMQSDLQRMRESGDLTPEDEATIETLSQGLLQSRDEAAQRKNEFTRELFNQRKALQESGVSKEQIDTLSKMFAEETEPVSTAPEPSKLAKKPPKKKGLGSKIFRAALGPAGGVLEGMELQRERGELPEGAAAGAMIPRTIEEFRRMIFARGKK